MYVTVLIRARPRVEFVCVPETAVQPGNRVWRYREGVLSRVSLDLVRTPSDARREFPVVRQTLTRSTPASPGGDVTYKLSPASDANSANDAASGLEAMASERSRSDDQRFWLTPATDRGLRDGDTLIVSPF
jgi:hypothetical protein